ncbi:hypothetical protein [Pantoea vagans]|uniref:hypothetical protein n=1 Tax=Pantoea vagans TaxID=470934 RepID=UPI00320A9CC3
MKFDIDHLKYLAERLDYKPDSQQHKDNLANYCNSDRMMAIAEAFRALEHRAEAAEAEKAGAEERCRMMFDAKNHWADRARAAEAKMVPDSWQLVPIEPSWEMLSADGCKEHHNGQPCLHHDNRKRIWSAMLAVVPTPPQ